MGAAKWGQGTWDRELGTGNWGAGNWGAANWGQGTWDREGTGTGNLGRQGTDRELAGNWANWGQGTWDRELGTGNWNWELGTTLRRRERVLLLAQVEPWAGGGRMLDERVGL